MSMTSTPSTTLGAAWGLRRDSLRRTVSALAGGAALTSICAGLPAQAADWHWDPRIQLGGVYNDNFRLTRAAPVEVTGAQLDALLQIRALTPKSEFRLTPRLLSTFFPSDKDQETNDQFLNADYIYRGQRLLADFAGAYMRQSVLRSELPDTSGIGTTGLGNTQIGDTGFVTVRSRRDTLHLDPTATIQLTQRYKLQLGMTYDDVDYTPDLVGSYVDFKSYSALVGLGFDVSPRSTVYLNTVGLHYQPRSTFNQDSDSYGARVEWWYHSSETLQAYLRGGADRTQGAKETPTSPRESSTNYIVGAGVNGLYRVTALFVDVTRAVVPNGGGGLITRTQLQLRAKRTFSPRYAGFINVYATDDSAAQNNTGFRDRSYAISAVGLEWRFLREFSVQGQYDYRWQKYQGDPGGAHGNEVIVSLVYQPHRPADDLTLGYYQPARVY